MGDGIGDVAKSWLADPPWQKVFKHTFDVIEDYVNYILVAVGGIALSVRLLTTLSTGDLVRQLPTLESTHLKLVQTCVNAVSYIIFYALEKCSDLVNFLFHCVLHGPSKRDFTLQGEVSPYSCPPVWLIWIQLFCWFKTINRQTCLAKSKPVKQEDSRSPTISVLCLQKWLRKHRTYYNPVNIIYIS